MALHQAVYALLDEGESVREIADHLALSKSKAGRIVKRLSDTDGSLANMTFLGPRGAGDETRSLVLDAWGFSDLADATMDHPRGTHEPGPEKRSTTFGGLNG